LNVFKCLKPMEPIPHPKPFQSALWPHLPLIRKLRLARKTWPEVAAELAGLGVHMNPWAIGRFFKRAQKGKLPAGFEERNKNDIPEVPLKFEIVDPLLAEIPQDSPWKPQGKNSREWLERNGLG